MTKHKVKLTREQVQNAIDNTPTMGAAANFLNLELLCPNCHSQTDTYRSKKLKLKNTEG